MILHLRKIPCISHCWGKKLQTHYTMIFSFHKNLTTLFLIVLIKHSLTKIPTIPKQEFLIEKTGLHMK